MTARNTSITLSPAARNLLNAWQDYHRHRRRGARTGRSYVIARLLATTPPPRDDTPEAAAVADAHRTYLETIT